MALKVQVEGTLNFIDESNNNKIELSFDLARDFGIITNVVPHLMSEQSIKLADGDVTLPLGGVDEIKGYYIRVIGSASIDFKHSTNTNTERIDRAKMSFGNISAPIISTSSTTEVLVKYVFFK